jgi:hypothetical protein
VSRKKALPHAIAIPDVFLKRLGAAQKMFWNCMMFIFNILQFCRKSVNSPKIRGEKIPPHEASCPHSGLGKIKNWRPLIFDSTEVETTI